MARGLKSALTFASTDVISWEYNLAKKRFVYVSKQAEQLLGYPIEDWYTDNFWEDHIHPEDREQTINFCSIQTSQKLDHQIRYRMLKADGSSLWVHDVVSVIDDAKDGRIMRGLIFDASRYEAITENILQKKQQVEQSKLAQRKYTEAIGHELQEQINQILGLSDRLADSPDQENAEQLINDLQTFAQAQLKTIEELIQHLRYNQ